MTIYEAFSIWLSILSVGPTIFFGFAVLKVSKEANEIAQKAVQLQEEELNKKRNIFITDLSNQTSNNITEVEENKNSITDKLKKKNKKNKK